ncbi:MAG: DUF1343 domain-containing protein [Kiritimatiellae bacterium]|nr:DUF1343 domain-containing protein [Kiritimatiellia bacterium]
MQNTFLSGIENFLCTSRRSDHEKIGLIAHPASVCRDGVHASQKLWNHSSIQLTCLLGPEHGFLGEGVAGETISDLRHPEWNIPIYSLYGETRKPTEEMLEDVDTLIFDLQDIGIRCYTYLGTLLNAMEACAHYNKALIITDRPIPLPNVIDGPLLHPDFTSVVGPAPVPLVYGMTPGEMALWLKENYALDVDLHVEKMTGYHRDNPPSPKPWTPPSPGIRSWESAMCYPITVFSEALPIIDCWRRGAAPFQVIGTPWLKSEDICEALARAKLSGISFSRFQYEAIGPPYEGEMLNSIRINVTNATSYRPVNVAIHLLSILQTVYGTETLWTFPNTKEDFFDKLMGTDTVRKGLQENRSPEDIVESWNEELTRFVETRELHLLYA